MMFEAQTEWVCPDSFPFDPCIVDSSILVFSIKLSPRFNKVYIKTLLNRGDNLMEKTRIELSTMHGSKGNESGQTHSV
jgi:hypothetical protein